MQEPSNSHLPLPSFKIDKNYDILERSTEAVKHFKAERSFLTIVDEDSVNKVKHWLQPEHEQMRIEVNVFTVDGELILVDLYVGWISELHAEVLVVKKDEAFSRVMNQLAQLRSRLQDTNMQLMVEKERLEVTMEENRQLSAPFITLNDDVALVPMFGDLDDKKIRSVEDKLLKQIYEDSADDIIFDFTAVGKISDYGMVGLKNLLQSLSVMGMNVTIAGVDRSVAASFQQFEVQKWNLVFQHSLESALKSMKVTQ
ncbi:STAS domain-containing protein [Geomicrobium sp. JCM 19055]|uniref:STAS domain-containing protein n=1 Tax=Geomicrobium sp. JCM 19055 TaxID=1460649 RepID=UPI00045ED68E|nr:STAS domain-containing protein [Geomicrobium sp. JCM 19055]GAJ98443.1 hypothetical protein JCM19055_1370 [Geomicrobium sp. JCM 19055]